MVVARRWWSHHTVQCRRSSSENASNPRSKLSIRPMRLPRMIATWRASRGRHPVECLDYRPRCTDFRHPEGQYFVGKRVEAAECGADGVGPAQCGVPVQDFLVDLDVRDETLAPSNQSIHELDGTGLVWVGRTDQVHRYVRINECHAESRPASISRNISSISAVGNSWVAASATAASLASTAAG